MLLILQPSGPVPALALVVRMARRPMAMREYERPAGRPGGPPAVPASVLEQAFDRGSLSALRAAVAAFATRAGLAPGRVGDVVLVTHELASNAVRHGAGCGRLRMWTYGLAVSCEVTDDGRPAASAGAAAPPAPGDRLTASAPWAVEHGHGLWVVGQLADQSSQRSGPGGTTAAVRFSLPRPGS
jgi:anti-sigma regulatory factor (Ser/Thr protein kinase)